MRDRLNNLGTRLHDYGARIARHLGLQRSGEQVVAQNMKVPSSPHSMEPSQALPHAQPVQAESKTAAISARQVQQSERGIQFVPPTPQVHQALMRLATVQDHARGVSSKGAEKDAVAAARSALQSGTHAQAVTAFMASVTPIMDSQVILKSGRVFDEDIMAKHLVGKSEDIVEGLRQYWPAIHAGAQARFDLAKIDAATLIMSDRKENLVLDNYEKQVANWRTPEKMLIEPIKEWPVSIEARVSHMLKYDADLARSEQMMRQGFDRVWTNPSEVVNAVKTRIFDGERPGQIALAIKKDPALHGNLKGATNFFGRPDDARRSALDALNVAMSHMGDYGGLYERLQVAYRSEESAMRQRLEQGLADLSPAAHAFVERSHEAFQKSQDYSTMVNSSDDKRALSEVRSFLADLYNHFQKRGGVQELDLERMAKALPMLEADQMKSLTVILEKVDNTSNYLKVAKSMEGISRSMEQSIRSKDSSSHGFEMD